MLTCFLKSKTIDSITDEIYKDYMAKLSLTMASDSHIENGREFSEVRKDILNPSRIDDRSAKQIIDDTFRKHGLKLGGE
jgi:hypothetical protein